MKIHEITLATSGIEGSQTANRVLSDSHPSTSQNSTQSVCIQTSSLTAHDLCAQKLKIELALEGLNLDAEEIKDLRRGFSLDTTSEDVSDALLELHRKGLEDNCRRKKRQVPPSYAYNPYPSQYSRRFHYPGPNVFQALYRPMKSIRESCHIHIKVRDYKDRWEILVFAPDFEIPNLKILLIDKPNRTGVPKYVPFPNALLIKGCQVYYSKNHDGLSIQRVRIGEAIAELHNNSPPGDVTMIPLASGHMKVKILKQ
jgi:hypothetical protein